jgi:hypothetical protein
VVKAAMLDMDLAIAVYIEAGRRDRKQTLERLATDFEKAVGGVVDEQASAATQLESSAKTMVATAELHRRPVEGRRRCFADATRNVQAVSQPKNSPAQSPRSVGRSASPPVWSATRPHRLMKPERQ